LGGSPAVILVLILIAILLASSVALIGSTRESHFCWYRASRRGFSLLPRDWSGWQAGLDDGLDFHCRSPSSARVIAAEVHLHVGFCLLPSPSSLHIGLGFHGVLLSGIMSLLGCSLRFTFTLAFVCYLLLPAFTLVLVFMAILLSE
jgi:hypothetical protein